MIVVSRRVLSSSLATSASSMSSSLSQLSRNSVSTFPAQHSSGGLHQRALPDRQGPTFPDVSLVYGPLPERVVVVESPFRLRTRLDVSSWLPESRRARNALDRCIPSVAAWGRGRGLAPFLTIVKPKTSTWGLPSLTL